VEGDAARAAAARKAGRLPRGQTRLSLSAAAALQRVGVARGARAARRPRARSRSARRGRSSFARGARGGPAHRRTSGGGGRVRSGRGVASLRGGAVVAPLCGGAPLPVHRRPPPPGRPARGCASRVPLRSATRVRRSCVCWLGERERAEGCERRPEPKGWPKAGGSTSVGAARGGGGGARRGGGPLLARRRARAGARAAAQRARRFCRAARRHRRGAQHLPRRLPAGRVRAGTQLRRPGPISLLCAAARLGPVRAAGGLRAARGGAL